MENKENLEGLYIKLLYNDKEIVVNDNKYYKKEDENNKEIKGEVPTTSVEELVEFVVSEENFKKLLQLTLEKGFVNNKFLELRYKGQFYKLPLDPPANIDNDFAEEVHTFAKDRYFDLLMLGDYIKAKNEIPEMIKNLEKGSEFNFNDYFKKYFIDDDREKFELFFEISKELKGQFAPKNKGAVEGLPHNLTYIKL